MNAWDRLNRRIVACERCPRLRAWCRQVANEKRRSFADHAEREKMRQVFLDCARLEQESASYLETLLAGGL